MKSVQYPGSPHLELKLYPDNQPHVRLLGISAGDKIHLRMPIRSSLELVHLMQISNALTHARASKCMLTIPYLMGARFDRLMEDGDSFDLEVVADVINGCVFESVALFDVHSDVALSLINGSRSITNQHLVESYGKDDAVLIVPDKGATVKAANYPKWNKRLVDVVHCDKKRDPSNGRITLEVLEPEKCADRNCVIIDDLCDGGGTFLAIAEQIKPAHLTLIVSHGIFSRGFKYLEAKFQSIVTTDSFYEWSDFHSPILQCIPFNP